MSYIKLQSTDFVISADSIITPTWTNNQPTLTSFYTSSTVSAAPTFYLDVYQTSVTSSNSEKQFSISYGHIAGSGSVNYNNLIPGYSPSRTVYGQYRTLVYGDENSTFSFGVGSTTQGTGMSTVTPVTPQDILVISVERSKYKEHLLPGSLNLYLTDGSGNTLKLTDNSKAVTINSYLDCGRVYDIVSGSYGTATTSTVESGVTPGYTKSGSYGLFLPDIGTLVLNTEALKMPFAKGGVSLTVGRTSNVNGDNPSALYRAISGSNAQYFQMNSEETISSDYLFLRIGNQDCNYTTNPSMISGSGDFVYSSFVNNPQTYITTVGLYNDNNELLAVAKTSKPLKKDFITEALFRVKLDW
jgi:hypothetical protein